MSHNKLIRLSHFSLIFGGICVILLGPQNVISWFLLLVGLLGLHFRQLNKVGWLGHLSLLAIIISSILPIFFSLIGMDPTGSSEAITVNGLFRWLTVAIFQLVGFVIYGIATYRARVLKVEISLILFACSFMVVFIGHFGLAVSVIGLGVFLLCSIQEEKVSEIKQPA